MVLLLADERERMRRRGFCFLLMSLLLCWPGGAEKSSPSRTVWVAFKVYPPDAQVEQELPGSKPAPLEWKDGKLPIRLYADGMVNLRFSKSSHESKTVSRPVDFFAATQSYPEPLRLEPEGWWIRVLDGIRYPTATSYGIALGVLAGLFYAGRRLDRRLRLNRQNWTDQQIRNRIRELGGPAEPNTLGNYILLHSLGSGGNAEVWKAIHSERIMEKPVALKKPHEHFSGDESATRRFEREAERMKAVVHPNLIQVYAVERNEGQMLLIMELLDGKTLTQVVSEQGPMEPKLVLPILRDIASACMTLHTKGLVHRDLTSNNVMLLKKGGIKVLDLGLSKDQNESRQLTSAGELFGTPQYFPADSFIEDRDGQLLTTGAYDQFSWGVLAYYLLTAKYPIQITEQGQAAMMKYLNTVSREDCYKPTPLHEVDSRFGPEVSEVLAKAMAFYRSDRYDTIDEAYRALEKVLKRY